VTDQTQSPVSSDEDELTYCAVHPDRETSLRCNKCNRYMCVECAVQTPVVYRCRVCARQHDDRFFNATQNDVVTVFAVCAGMGLVGGVLIGMLDWILIGLLLGFPAGGAIGEAAMRAIQHRRGRNNAQAGASGVVIGGLVGAAARAYLAYPDRLRDQVAAMRQLGLPVPEELTLSSYILNHTFTIGIILFLGLAAYAVYYRMKV
jgi:hypothetical protein